MAPENLGDPDLKPEVSSEIEVGFEIGLLNDRLGLEFTYWDRVVNDALVYQQFAPSGGFRNRQLTNIGQIDANGLDFTLNYRAVQNENFSLDLFANAAYLDEVVTSLGGAAEQKISGLKVLGAMTPEYQSVLSEDAMALLTDLVQRFGPRRDELLAARVARQKEFDAGALPDFLPETAELRQSDARGSPIESDPLFATA